MAWHIHGVMEYLGYDIYNKDDDSSCRWIVDGLDFGRHFLPKIEVTKGRYPWRLGVPCHIHSMNGTQNHPVL